MINILFICENIVIESHTGEILEGLKYISNKCIAVDYYSYFLNNGKKKFENKIKEIIINENINILIIGLGDAFVIDPFFLANLSNNYNLKVCIIFGDPEHNFEHHDRYYAQCSDICWIFSPATTALFRLYGFSVFDQIGLSKIHRYFGKVEKKYEVSFIGGINRGDRIEYLEYLKSNSINVFLAGSGSNIGKVTYATKDEIIQSSLIHINFSKVENKTLNIYSRIRQFKGRLYESYMLGTFCLTEYYYGIEEQLGPRYKQICFRSKEELLKMIKYYLANDSERDELTAHFKKIVLDDYSSSKVSKDFLKKFKLVEFKEKQFINDKMFSEKYFSMRVYYFGWFIGRGWVLNAIAELKGVSKGILHVKLKNIIFQFIRGLYHSFKKG